MRQGQKATKADKIRKKMALGVQLTRSDLLFLLGESSDINLQLQARIKELEGQIAGRKSRIVTTHLSPGEMLIPRGVPWPGKK